MLLDKLPSMYNKDIEMSPVIRTLLLSCCLLLGMSGTLQADDQLNTYPLKPLDYSSPLATMKSYIESVNASFDYLYGEHWHDPSEETVNKIAVQAEVLMRLIDTSDFPPVVRQKMAAEASLHLAEVIRRIDPDALLAAPGKEAGVELPNYWTVPDTDISIVRIEDGERAGDYVFSAETAERAAEFYELIKDHPVHGESNDWLSKREYLTPSGWMLSSSTIETFPEWTKKSYFGQGLWKIVILCLFTAFWVVLIFFTVRAFPQRNGEQDISKYLRKLCLPLMIILISWNIQALLFQVSFTGVFATGLAFTSAVMLYVGLAIFAMPITMLFVELVIRSPHIPPDCLDAHLLRLGGRTVGLGLAITFLFLLAEQIGFPLYGLVAGVGVGGLAVALAARQSLENYLAGINLLSDRPITIGDLCRYEECGEVTFGVIESVGMRSTRIRNIDNSVTSVANSLFANMMITNLSARRGAHLFRKNLRLQMNSPQHQVNNALTLIRGYLLEHGQVIDTMPQVHLESIGPDAINIRISCQLQVDDEENEWIRFLNLQQEILISVSEIVHEGGLEFAYPTATIENITDLNPA